MKLIRPLQGSIVTLRTIELADAQRCAVWLSDPNILRYMMTPTQTVESERTWIRKVRRSPTELVVSIQVREENGHLRHVGNCGLHRINHGDRTAEAGIFIGDTLMHRRGIAQDAIKTLARYATNICSLRSPTRGLSDGAILVPASFRSWCGNFFNKKTPRAVRGVLSLVEYYFPATAMSVRATSIDPLLSDHATVAFVPLSAVTLPP